MILDAARLSLLNLFAPETRNVFWKTLGLTILVLVGLWFGLRELFSFYAWPWMAAFFPDLPDWTGWLTFIGAPDRADHGADRRPVSRRCRRGGREARLSQ